MNEAAGALRAEERDIAVEGSYDLVRTMAALCDGSHDPTWQIRSERGDASAVRAQWTPDGPVTAELHHRCGRSSLHGLFRGPGARWLADRMEWFCGLNDTDGVPNAELHTAVRSAVAKIDGFRTARSLSLLDVVVPTVLGQRVTKAEAHRSFAELVRRHGRPAPGYDQVRLGPDAATMLRLGDADWHSMGVERRRADAVRVVLRRIDSLERAASLNEPATPNPAATAEFRRVAESLPGIGEWTSSSLASVVTGDPDVVVLGDLHLPNGICWALASEPRGDDERMLELLEPFRPQRGRVARLLKFSGLAGAPRRGPRYNPLPIRDM